MTKQLPMVRDDLTEVHPKNEITREGTLGALSSYSVEELEAAPATRLVIERRLRRR